MTAAVSSPMWSDIDASSSIVFCIGMHDLGGTPDGQEPGQTVSQLNSVKAAVPLSDAFAVASLSDFMGRHDYRYRLTAPGDVTLASLRRHPAVMLGGLDNVWTMKLIQNLPYSLLR